MMKKQQLRKVGNKMVIMTIETTWQGMYTILQTPINTGLYRLCPLDLYELYTKLFQKNYG